MQRIEGRPSSQEVGGPQSSRRTTSTVAPRTLPVTAHRRWRRKPSVAASVYDIACHALVFVAWLAIAVGVIAFLCLGMFALKAVAP